MQWEQFGNAINNSFFFVIDKILDLMPFFHEQAYSIAKVVLLIALLSTGLNYALTGTGLKDNVIKILKATLFFFIIMIAYPRIIGWITNYAFVLAKGSIFNSVEKHFQAVTEEVTQSYDIIVPAGPADGTLYMNNNTTNVPYKTFTNTYTTQIKGNDNLNLFSDLTKNRLHQKTKMTYTVAAPAAVMKIIFFIAGECMNFADNKEKGLHLPDFSRVLKGLICAFTLIITGAFALIEYIICFLEFMLVASVGIIVFPLSLWEASKFAAEGFIKAIIGFFMKLLFCNIAVFLLIYGFITLFYIIAAKNTDGVAQGFTGELDQIVFISFFCLLFFVICKSAPGVAQSILTGAPSLTGAGAIGAVAGVAAGVAATAGFVKSKASAAKDTAGSIVGGVAKTSATFAEAGAAAKAAGENGGSRWNQAGAFMSSLGKNASASLARSIYGNQSGGMTMGEVKQARETRGAQIGLEHMNKKRSNA
ncbi:MAG: type IV secretion system protein [Treponema sp.]|jgi:hypothetical protein|nr:type IV secretion system protein [Treponema sp.]